MTAEFKDTDLYGIEGPNTGRIQDLLRDPVRLKNWWDQYALQAADRIDALEAENESLRAVTDELVKALEGMIVMSSRGPKPEKLDAALSWRANDELAHARARAALSVAKE